MAASFFIRRFLLAFAIAIVVLGLAQFLKGHSVDHSLREALAWGLVTAVVYTSVLAYKLRHLPGSGK